MGSNSQLRNLYEIQTGWAKKEIRGTSFIIFVSWRQYIVLIHRSNHLWRLGRMKVLQVIESPYSSSLHKPARSDLSRQGHACASHERSRTRLLLRTQSLKIYELIEIATPLVLQRKKLPGDDLCHTIQPNVITDRTTGECRDFSLLTSSAQSMNSRFLLL